MDIKRKTAIVTGGASGIGSGIVKALLAKDCRVIIADYDGEAATRLAHELGDNSTAIQFDAAEIDSIDAMADKVWTDTGGVDLVFANAGISANEPLLQASPSVFDWHMNVNVRGVWATGKALINKMIEAGRKGHFAITASEHSFGLQHAGAGFYTASKHAVLGIAEIMRAELPESIGISILCPGLVDTKLYDAGRFGLVPTNEDMKAFGAAIMRKGMSAEEIGIAAVEGIMRGDFYIVTHPLAFVAAEKRFTEIKHAFAAQAPMSEEAKQYDVNVVAAKVLEELG